MEFYVYRDLRTPLFPTNSYSTASISIKSRLTDKQAAKGCQAQSRSKTRCILNSQHLPSVFRLLPKWFGEQTQFTNTANSTDELLLIPPATLSDWNMFSFWASTRRGSGYDLILNLWRCSLSVMRPSSCPKLFSFPVSVFYFSVGQHSTSLSPHCFLVFVKAISWNIYFPITSQVYCLLNTVQ